MGAVSAAAGVAYTPVGDVVLVAASPAVVGWLCGSLDASHPVAPVRRAGYIQAVVVHPGARRRGVGAALVEAFLDRAREAGVGWVFAAPDEDGDAAGRLRWVHALGFEATSDPDPWPVMGRWT
ncbi:GNAT family N-acetyltransferase [Nocardiopsis sp. NPDC006139]|uniref:GNAT family N-acetyltransferase n=1 Tax=Nocardiopsis sp. NPDC006139 TaxID=3154578 RepID=UPI0033B94B8C